MRRRIICLLCCMLMMFMFTACGSESQNVQDSTDGSAETSVGTTSDVDVDLTQLSSTMVYSEVFNMMTTPEDYIDKTVKMRGAFAVSEDEVTGQTYFGCIISDATACCSQGIEFVLDGNYVYPDDYPELDSEITVTGTFETYEENGARYCTLKKAKME